uniref:allantoinase n=1 Tax=Sphenodon punctatus TaxID=8508 RepID=A0A8D0HR23_SPHPU
MVEVGSEVMAVRSSRVVLDNAICPAEIVISNGKIAEILPHRSWAQAIGEKVLDVGDLVVMPGLIDPHVHICEPGHAAWEGFSAATKAAAAGGVTTIVDMPLNCLPPTTTLGNLDAKLKSAKGQCHVDVAFWGGLVPGNQRLPMLNAGVPGLGCFLIADSTEEFHPLCLHNLHMAMNELQGTECVILVRAMPPPSPSSCPSPRLGGGELRQAWFNVFVLFPCRVPCHILHLSSAQALPIIQEARQKGAPLTVETAHHHLTLASECIPPGGTYYKCCPPIRDKSNQEQLWVALQEGQIDMVVSAHTPRPPELRCEGDFLKAQAGISSLQLGLPLFWTSAKPRGFSLHDLVRVLCKRPAVLSRVDDRKGSLSPGMDADLVIWDPDKEFEVKKHMIHHRHKLTPYLGFQLHGEVFSTVVRGRLAYLNGKFAPKPQGDLINASSVTWTRARQNKPQLQ